MFKLVVYQKDTNTLIDQRFYLTEPDYDLIKTFCREMIKLHGDNITVLTEEVRYANLGAIQ